jgi:hypothetical protein
VGVTVYRSCFPPLTLPNLFVEQLRIKQEMVNDELRTKSTILAVSDIDYIAENQKMLDAIAKYN